MSKLSTTDDNVIQSHSKDTFRGVIDIFEFAGVICYPSYDSRRIWSYLAQS